MRNYFLIIYLLVLSAPVSAHLNASELDELRDNIKRIAQRYHIPDYAIRITQNGQPLFEANANPDRAEQPYLIGSCSKSFTALGILTLVAKGRLNLDAPVYMYLPWFQLKDKAQSKTITIRQLLNQTSGLSQGYGYFDYFTTDVNIFEQQLAAYCQTIVLPHAPGARFNYCNLNYMLLGLVMERVTGQTYSDYMQQTVFAPLGMTATTANLPDRDALVPGYQYALAGFPLHAPAFKHSRFLAPQGLISSTTGDLCLYLNALMNNKLPNDSSSILPDTLFNALLKKELNKYAMGWVVNGQAGKPWYRHTGLNEDYAAITAFNPADQLCVATLINVNSFDFCSEVQQIIQGHINKKPHISPRFPVEMLKRYAIAALMGFLLLRCIISFRQWHKYRYPISLKGSLMNRIIWGIQALLYAFILFFILQTNQIALPDLIRFQPDIGYALILITIAGIMTATLGYWNKSTKYSAIAQKDKTV
jgi:CubicO group peptidase (beta-lactamase class C family)